MSATRNRPPHARAATRARAVVLALTTLAPLACAGAGNYGVAGRYQHPEPAAAPAPSPALLSAQVSRFGTESAVSERSREPGSVSGPPRMLEGDEFSEDRILLVFDEQLDPMTIDPRNFAIMRGDGRRVRPTRAFLAPADEGDEHRSLTLTGNFGGPESPPVAIHVIGELYSEAGVSLSGLDAEITGPTAPDRVVAGEQLEPDPSRCPGARQVIRTYWTDTLADVGDDDLAHIELRLGDGRVLAPTGFDDQAQRASDEPTPGLGRADDNVLDLCVDAEPAVLQVRFAAAIFTDANGLPTAAADLALPAATAALPGT
ncbi:hypothetical protein DB30_05110 [Enhygromyxa salina]|uniref:SbsA Ig-like domain-containing protein n=1 Tax=Enhygromyxa salina TaxID=215803 RepID=A0A0C1ZE30_9BACT|nr:hypothetical protein [Enhygromyxa salina]KIG15919.1 hypothetical protein DB30_05110 [Enhygromyxa salina]